MKSMTALIEPVIKPETLRPICFHKRKTSNIADYIQKRSNIISQAVFESENEHKIRPK